MNNIDIIRMGLKNLVRRKARTFLTVLGVIIGTAAIITMISLGLGIKNTFIEQVKQFGSLTSINVMPSMGGQAQVDGSFVKGNNSLNDKAVRDLQKLPGVIAVIPAMQTDFKLVSGKYVANVNVKGIKPEHMKYLEIKLQKGKLLQKGERYGVVYGAQVARSFYNPSRRNDMYSMGQMNQKPKVDIFTDKIIGTVDSSYGEPKSPIIMPSATSASGTTQQTPKAKQHKMVTEGLTADGNYENAYTVFMDLDTVKEIIREKTLFNKAQSKGSQGGGYYMGNQQSQQGTYQSITVKVNDIKDVKDAQTTIKKMGYEVYSSMDQLNQVEKISNIIQMVLGGIAAISLFVASLGITNTMIMAIYERTRDIGVMKVIGARLIDIKKMFLFESALIGLIGGIIGSVLSFIASAVLNKVLASSLANAVGGGMPTDGAAAAAAPAISIIPFWLILFALAFTTMIGVVSGYYPAKRAMKLSAIEAIKTE